MAYNQTNWQELPSTNTPLSANNLNKIENELGLTDKSLKYNGQVPTDWNDARTFGVYHVSGSGYQNAIATGGIYGILIVYESFGGTWTPVTDGSSWIWQEFRDTAGGIYKRYAVNDANTWSPWDDTGWNNAPINSPAAALSWNPLQFRRIGKTVFVRGGVTYGQTPTFGTQIGSLSSYFTPPLETDLVCRGISTDGTPTIAITSTGEINYLSTSNSYPGDGFIVNGSYLLD